ncbi:hypothetical protein [Fructobacillus tropaeoli]|nr:unnamed protein product [Fructobacillus tropaeoli]
MTAITFRNEKEALNFKKQHDVLMYCHLAGTKTWDIVYKETHHD